MRSIGFMMTSSIISPDPWTLDEIKPELHVFRRGRVDGLVIPYSVQPNNAVTLLAQNEMMSASRLVFVVHGFRNTVQIPWMQEMKDALLKESNQTVILVNWGIDPDLVINGYLQTASNIQPVGEWLAAHISQLALVQGRILWGIGHSMGCHLLGIAGRQSERLDRISAMDPAGPAFEDEQPFARLRLCPTDAVFVDVIHTDGYDSRSVLNSFDWISPVNHYGTLIPLGTIDFYPNFGNDQPSSGPVSSNLSSASHLRAIDLFLWSIANPLKFRTKEGLDGTPAFESPVKKVKEMDAESEMGYHAYAAPAKAGIYYIQTTEAEPWVKNWKEPPELERQRVEDEQDAMMSCLLPRVAVELSTAENHTGSLSQKTGNQSDGLTLDEKDEARKGNPNFIYKKKWRDEAQTQERATYKCQECPFCDDHYKFYLNHLDGHKEKRPHPCNKCSFTAKTEFLLNKHKLLHTAQPHESPEIATGTDEPLCMPGAKRKRKCSGGASGRSAKHVCPGISTSVQSQQQLSNGRNQMDAHVNSDNNASLSSSPSVVDASPASSSAVVPVPVQPTGALSKTLTPGEYEKLISGNPKFSYMTVATNGQPLPVETSFKCWHCPFATAKYPVLVTHQRRHEVKAKYECNQCTYSASSIQAIKNHKLAHTIPLQEVNETSNGQLIPFRRENPRSLASPSPFSALTVSSSSVHESRGESGQFFISNIRITNIMTKIQEPTVTDLSTHGILKLKGKSVEGKSSYVLAVMLGLGYDLMLDNRDETTTIAGIHLNNAISDGRDFGSVELTVSLRAFPQLQKDFGSQIKFSRRIERRNPQLCNVIAITSADPRPQFKQAHPKVLNGRELANFLPKLKLSPERLRLMLLDGGNVKYFMDNSHLWYVLFEAAVEESDIDAVQKTNETQFLLERLDEEEKLQRELWELFQSRLGWRPPVDSEKIKQLTEEDWAKHRKCTTELDQLANERKELEQKLANYAQQSRDGVDGYIQKMRSIFHKFLDLLNYHGEIMVCERSRSLGICIWKADSKEVRPTTLEGVDGMWRTLSNGKRRIAVIGLYLALWEISCYLGIVAADAFSCTEADFHVPPAALPVFWDLINRKCLEHKQCIVSLIPEY